MSQEFFINSQELEDKIRQLLPSQGGAGASFDLSASTQIIPIIDLTESAQGSNVRQDLQTALSFGSSTRFIAENNTQTPTVSAGWYQLTFVSSILSTAATNPSVEIQITDGVSTKSLWQHVTKGNSGTSVSALDVRLILYLEAGESVNIVSNSANAFASGSIRQIATSLGELVNP
tara:strand:+ start:45 stop:569 length:525 start_codon:yes stop_codon:yes gene_type:complete